LPAVFPEAVKFIFVAFRTTLGSAATERRFPLKLTIGTVKQAGLVDNPVVAAFDVDGFAVNQGIGDRISGLLNDPTEGCTGNAHTPTGILMGHPQQIGQSNGLTLINGQANFLQINHGNAPGLEVADLRIKSDHAVFLWSYHIDSFMRIFSKQEAKYFPVGCQVFFRRQRIKSPQKSKAD
jgi:hypothetical protein